MILNNTRNNHNSSATGHLKCTEGIFLDEVHKCKSGGNLDDLCTRLKTHFKKHGMDRITCRTKPNDHLKMVSVFTSCPLFTVNHIKMQNSVIIIDCDTCNKQNNGEAIECFVNSLGEDL